MANFTVTTLTDVVDADDVVLSLREALTLAHDNAGPDTITFAASLVGGSTPGIDNGRLVLTNGQLVVDGDVTINGDAVGNDHVADITVDAANSSRVFDITAGTSTLDALVITRGFVFSGSGGGVRIASGADVTIDHSTISGNSFYSGGNGGGISNAGTLTLTNTTIADNTAGGYFSGAGGGGLFNASGATAALTNVTVYGNSTYSSGGGILNEGTATLTNVTITGNAARGASGDGGGIYNDGTATLANSVVAGNFASSGASEFREGSTPSTPTTFDGLNIIGVGGDTSTSDNVIETASLSDLFVTLVTIDSIGKGGGFQAGALADNGGPVETVALAQLRTNPAIDVGDDTLAPTTDARGEARADAPGVGNDGVNYSDLGAFEIAVSAASLETPSLVVTTADDVVDWTDGLTSLREALTLANGGDALGDGLPDVITFDAALAGETLTLTQGQLTISSDVTIDGDAAGNDDTADITIDAGGLSRVFDIAAGTSTLDALVITGGFVFSGNGGGVRIASGADVTIDHSTISGNQADRGGGIWSDGTVALTNTTIAENATGYYGGKDAGGYGNGGGLYVGSNGAATLANVTIYGNDSDDGGGGVYNNGTATLTNTTITGNSGGTGKGDQAGGIINHGTATLTNSIVAGNFGYSAKGPTPDITGNNPTFLGLNIVGVGNDTDAGDHVIKTATLVDLFDTLVTIASSGKGGFLAGGLADNGGPVETVALAQLRSNPAIDAGDDALAALTDARGEARVDVPGVGNDGADYSDLGAFEAQVSGPLEAPSLVVTTAADVIDWSDGVTSLREALALANSAANGGDALNDGLPDIITFDPTLAGHTLTLTNGQLVISSGLTIEGDIDGDGVADIAIDANGLSRVFDVTAGTSVLDALVITGGETSGNGGGLRIANGASVAITNSTIAGNEADSGGGLANFGTATLVNVTVYGNTGYFSGGGLLNSGTLTLTNSTIATNTAVYDSGGGLSNFGTATLVNVTVYGNTGYYSGGGIQSSTTVTLVNSTVTGNATTSNYSEAGGIHSSGTATLTNSIVAGNYGGSSSNADLTGNSPTFLGLNIVGVGNDTDAGDHVINTPALSDLFAHVVTIDPDGPGGVVAFVAGELDDNGGAVPTVAIKIGGVAHNTGDDDAAVYDGDSNPGTPDVPIPADARGFARVADGHVDIGAFEQQDAAEFIVTTLDDGIDNDFSGGDLAAEKADGGGLSLREALALANGDPTTADTIKFDGSLKGGTLTLEGGELVITSDVTIDGDIGGDGTIDITISGDTTNPSAVFHAYSGTSTLNGLTITGGSALYGAGVSVGAYYSYGYANVTISNSTISDNQALYGGGISVDTGSSLRLINSTVSANTAYVGGGIAVNDGGTLTVINSTISDNGADVGFGPSGYGGGIANAGTTTLINSTISGNGAYAGGGLYNNGDLTLVNTTLANNDAYAGGGLYNADCGCGNVTLTNSTVSGNSAIYNGGGIANYAGTVEIINSIVAGNTAGGDGPDIYANSDPGPPAAVMIYSGVNVFSQADGGGPDDIHEADLAKIFAAIDPVTGGGELANNGGLVKTIAIVPRGVAHNPDGAVVPTDTEDADGNGNKLEDLPIDARGFTRVIGATVDIGAFELQNSPPIQNANTGLTLAEGATTTITAAALDFDDAEQADTTITFTVTTAATNGTLRNNGAALGIGGTFTQENINDGLITYTHNGGETTAAAFGFSVSDGVAPVTGQSFAFTINPVNDAPVVNGSVVLVAIAEDSGPRLITQAELLGNASDVDGPSLTAINLAIATGSGSLVNNNNGTWSYTPALNDDTSVSFTYQVTDGTTPVADSATLDITPVNDAPVVNGSVALVAIAEDSGARLITQAQLLGNASDIDGPSLTATGLTIATGGGSLINNNDGTWSYTPTLNDDTAVSFTYQVADGVAAAVADSATLDITQVNDAPVNTVPGTQSASSSLNALIAGLLVADIDAAAGVMTTSLAVTHGTLTVNSAGGAAVSGSGTGSVLLTGTLAQINTTLTAADNVVYHGVPGPFATDSLTVISNDGGNTGSGGALTDTDQVTINLEVQLSGTSGDDSFTALPGNERIDAGGGVDTITFGFRLVDATVAYSGNQVIIDGPSGSHTVLSGFERYVFTDGTVDNNDGSWLIDDLYYYSQYHDVWNAHFEADAHYNLYGWHEFRNPNAFFDTGVYLSIYQDVKASGVNPLTQFDTSGWMNHRIPSLNFDPDHYLKDNPDVAAAHIDPLEHFLHNGAAEGRQPTAPTELIAANGFDYVYYLQHNPDVRAAHVDPFDHFQNHGWLEGRNPNALFDTNGYLATYTDVAAAHVNPLDHFHLYGWAEGRDPSVNFDTTDYLSHYPDVAAAHIDPLKHFLELGIHEGRSPFADGHFG